MICSLPQIDQTDFGLPGQKYYQVDRDDKMLGAYEKYIEGVASLMGGGATDVNRLRDMVKDMVDFEIKLANVRRRISLSRTQC